MATTGSLNTQKPLALRAAAWCRPPLMLNAAGTSPSATMRAAVRVAPVLSMAASYMPG